MTSRGGRAIVGVAAAAAIGLGGLAWATDGFRALTVDAARRVAVAATPRPVPVGALRDAASGAPMRLGRDTVTIIDFVSTSCEIVCVAQGARFGALQDALRARGASSAAAVRLLTVSFDPDDDARRLDGWARVRGVDAAWWRVAQVAPASRRALLDAFGITVVRDPVGGWRHNAAFHLVDGRGRLARIVPADDPAWALRAADSLAVAH